MSAHNTAHSNSSYNNKVIEVFPGIAFTQVPYYEDDLSLYAIHSEGETLLIDAGFEADGPWFNNLMNHFGANEENTRLYVTHSHLDHIGAVKTLHNKGIAASRCKMEHEIGEFPAQDFLKFCDLEKDFTAQETEQMIPILKGATQIDCPLELLLPDSSITVGSREFRIIGMYGHGFGHGGLFEEKTGLLFTGDQPIDGKLAAIFALKPDTHDVTLFLDTLQRLIELKPTMMLPGHLNQLKGTSEINRVIEWTRKRIASILSKVYDTLRLHPSGLTVKEIAEVYYGNQNASRHNPDKDARRIARYARLFAYAEHLHDCGCARRSVNDEGALVYEPKKDSFSLCIRV